MASWANYLGGPGVTELYFDFNVDRAERDSPAKEPDKVQRQNISGSQAMSMVLRQNGRRANTQRCQQ
jgi:hypothetical protein